MAKYKKTLKILERRFQKRFYNISQKLQMKNTGHKYIRIGSDAQIQFAGFCI